MCSRRPALAIALSICLGAALAAAGMVAAGTVAADDDPAPAPPAAPKRPVPDGAVALPGLLVLPKERRIEAEAWVCITEGPLEYLATTPAGKLHETLFVIEASAQDVNLALILCGLKEKPQVRWQGEAVALTGDGAAIEAELVDRSGAMVRRPVEDFVLDRFLGAPLEPRPFVFTGSRFIPNPEARFEDAPRGTPKTIFAATASGSLIALYHDPDAILDNPRLTGGDIPILLPTFGLPDLVDWISGDERHRAHTERLPARGTRAVLHIRAAPAQGGPTPGGGR